MPLHGEAERMLEARLERFDHAVGCPSDGCQAFTDPPNRLMMERIGREKSTPEHIAQPPLLERDGVPRHVTAVLLPVHGGAMSRNILEQGPAERDVDHLQAAANPKQRDPPGDRLPYEGDLERVARGVRRIDAPIAPTAVARRIEIEAAADDDRVETPEILAQASEVVLKRLGPSTMAPQGCDVGLRAVDELARASPIAGIRHPDERGARA